MGGCEERPGLGKGSYIYDTVALQHADPCPDEEMATCCAALAEMEHGPWPSSMAIQIYGGREDEYLAAILLL